LRIGANPSDKPGTVSIQIPLRVRQRGGRKLMIAPDGRPAWTPPRSRVQRAMVKAVARAHRWRQMLESGEYTSITDLATAERINQSYTCRVLRLTLLDPGIIEAILDGRQPTSLQLDRLMHPLPSEWERQRQELCL
jgi:hypothetical protein